MKRTTIFPFLLGAFSLVAQAQINLNYGNLITCPLDSSGQNKSVARLPQTDFEFKEVSFTKGFNGAAFGAPVFYGNSYGRMERGLQTAQASFSLWFNTNAAQKESILLGWDNKGYGVCLSLGGKPKVYAHINNGQSYSYEHSANMADDRWHHVVGMFDGHTFTVYIDGLWVFSDKQYGPGKRICYDAPGLNLGALPKEGNPKYYAGLIDEVLVFNRALSQHEVELLSKKVKIAPGDYLNNPIVHLPFEQSDENKSPNLNESTQIKVYGGSFANNICSNGRGSNMKSFDGVNDYLSGSNILEVPKFALSCWLKTNTAKESFIAGWDSTGYRIVLNPKGKLGKIQAQVWVSKTEILTLVAPDIVNDGSCHFVVLAFNGQTAKLYIDGRAKDEKKASATPTASMATSGVFHAASTFLVGREREKNPQMPYFGNLDDIRLYNRDITESDIKTLMDPPPANKPYHEIYETSLGSYLAACNPTTQEASILAKTPTDDKKLFEEKVLPNGSILKLLSVNNPKVSWGGGKR